MPLSLSTDESSKTQWTALLDNLRLIKQTESGYNLPEGLALGVQPWDIQKVLALLWG